MYNLINNNKRMKRSNYIHRLACAACIALLLASVRLTAQTAGTPPADETLTFTFAPATDFFVLRGNEAQLEQLFSAVDRHRDAIASGRMPLRVDGYCASQPTRTENLRTAYLRASRVKSELITQKGLTEDAFITANYATTYDDGRKDVVVVTLRIPAKDEPKPAEPVKKEAERKEAPAQKEAPAEITPQPQPAATGEAPEAEKTEVVAEAASRKPYTLALRTNLLYDAFLLPTLGIEWRISESVGVKLDGSLSCWGGATGKVKKIWMLSPEVCWYLLENRRFYVGASGNYAEYNLYGYPLGNLMKDDTGYQGTLWSAGLTVGYQLRLCRALSLDFNLGLGYTRSEYDSFTMIDGVRVSKERNQSKNLWGPTQAGISLVWTF